MIAAALCAAVSLSAPAAQAAGMSKMTDVQVYCMFMPMATKCATPAKAAPAKPAAKVAMAAPVKVAAPKIGIKMMSCVPAAKGKAYLYECVWK